MTATETEIEAAEPGADRTRCRKCGIPGHELDADGLCEACRDDDATIEADRQEEEPVSGSVDEPVAERDADGGAPLAAAELARCEAVIKAGLATFMDVGQALAEINDQRLYRDQYETFEAYCRERWGRSRVHAYRQIKAAQTAALLPIGNRPKNELQARAIAPLVDHDLEQAAVVMAAVGPDATAADIKEAVAGILPARKRARQRVIGRPAAGRYPDAPDDELATYSLTTQQHARLGKLAAAAGGRTIGAVLNVMLDHSEGCKAFQRALKTKNGGDG